MTDLAQTTVDRRLAPRLNVALSARVDGAQRSRLAVTRNISQTGALLFAAGNFLPGDLVKISLLPETSDIQIHVRGRVLRAHSQNVEVPWCCALAVCFDSPLPPDSALFS
jgi:hypothetical protein